MALACFDTTYIIIGGINYTFTAFEKDTYAYTISFPYVIYPVTRQRYPGRGIFLQSSHWSRATM